VRWSATVVEEEKYVFLNHASLGAEQAVYS
jgi:hypothetical protein